jgi:hypothetical protein
MQIPRFSSVSFHPDQVWKGQKALKIQLIRGDKALPTAYIANEPIHRQEENSYDVFMREPPERRHDPQFIREFINSRSEGILGVPNDGWPDLQIGDKLKVIDGNKKYTLTVGEKINIEA